MSRGAVPIESLAPSENEMYIRDRAPELPSHRVEAILNKVGEHLSGIEALSKLNPDDDCVHGLLDTEINAEKFYVDIAKKAMRELLSNRVNNCLTITPQNKGNGTPEKTSIDNSAYASFANAEREWLRRKDPRKTPTEHAVFAFINQERLQQVPGLQMTENNSYTYQELLDTVIELATLVPDITSRKIRPTTGGEYHIPKDEVFWMGVCGTAKELLQNRANHTHEPKYPRNVDEAVGLMERTLKPEESDVSSKMFQLHSLYTIISPYFLPAKDHHKLKPDQGYKQKVNDVNSTLSSLNLANNFILKSGQHDSAKPTVKILDNNFTISDADRKFNKEEMAQRKYVLRLLLDYK